MLSRKRVQNSYNAIIIFKPGVYLFTEIVFQKVCVYVCMFICLSVCTHVRAKSSLYMRSEGVIEPVLNL